MRFVDSAYAGNYHSATVPESPSLVGQAISHSSLPGRPTPFRGQPSTSGSAQNLRCLAAMALPERPGGLRQTPVRRPRLRPSLSGPLHPSRGYLQPSAGLVYGRKGHLSLAGLGSPQRTEAPDLIARRILASLPLALASPRVRAHPQLRISGQPAACFAPAALLSLAQRTSAIIG